MGVNFPPLKVKQILTPSQFFAVELEKEEDVRTVAGLVDKPIFEDDERVFVIDGLVIYWARKVRQ